MADRKCECDEWKDGIAQIVGVQAMCLTHSYVPEYTAAPFRFCPWCGKKLVQFESKVEEPE